MNRSLSIKFLSLLFIVVIAFQFSCKSTGNNQAKSNESPAIPDRNVEIEAVRNSVVGITYKYKALAEPQETFHGTGFFISEKHIATALHVYENFDVLRKGKSKAEDKEDIFDIVIRKKSFAGEANFVVPIRLAASDKENDLAIFSFNPEDIKNQWQEFVIKPLPLDDKLPMIGDEIFLTGYFNKFEFPFSSSGTVSMISGEKFNLDGDIFDRAIFSDLTSMSGHSGGPLYSLRTHKVLGVTTQNLIKNNAFIRVSIATNSMHLKKLLDQLTSQENNNANQQ